MASATVRELWRYPVKSMLGERREHVRLDQRGVVGDRLYAVRDEAGKFGSGKTTRRFRRMDGLFRFRAVRDGDVPVVTLPDGTTLRGDDPTIHEAISAHLGLPVTLSREAEIPHFDAGALHLLTTIALRTLGESLAVESLAVETLDRRRFRPNILIETDVGTGAGIDAGTDATGFPEDAWVGRDPAVGDDVRLRVVGRTERCVMVHLAQDELPYDARILRAAARANSLCLGVYAEVVIPGVIRVGDRVAVL